MDVVLTGPRPPPTTDAHHQLQPLDDTPFIDFRAILANMPKELNVEHLHLNMTQQTGLAGDAMMQEMRARCAHQDEQYHWLCGAVERRLQNSGQQLDQWGRNIAAEFSTHHNRCMAQVRNVYAYMEDMEHRRLGMQHLLVQHSAGLQKCEHEGQRITGDIGRFREAGETLERGMRDIQGEIARVSGQVQELY